MECEVEFRVAGDHPALAGHFPGEPVLPAVVVLDRVIDAAEAWLGPGLSILALPQAKFMSSLRPGDTARICLSQTGGKVHFRVLCGDTTAATGVIVVGLGRGRT